ncbi:uncharacterized protein [Apostichopus japonicus]|uniref:uncharacterized protein n=1 Tax=Stichopus japonicus TaxID=307972 RepID=UPI003AB5E337
MNILLLQLFLVCVTTVTLIQGQTAGVECVYCSSTTFQDIGYSDLVSVYEDPECELGIGHVVTCPAGYACITIIGTETQFFSGYGNIDLHVVIRDCVETALLGVDTCAPLTENSPVVGQYPLGGGSELVSFLGELCHCDTNACNNVMAPPIDRPFRPHTPPPNTPGLQCRVCSHLEFHEDTLNDPSFISRDCEEGQLTSDQVNYVTCFEGSVCVNIRGEVTYSSEGFDFPAELHERRCLLPDEQVNMDKGCLPESALSDTFGSYSAIDTIEFMGGICYCNTSLCDCDPEVCFNNVRRTCAEFDFCPGENEVCVDGNLAPRCECLDGFGFDDRFQCRSVTEQCITCSSRHFVSDFTTSKALEDMQCERGLGLSYTCGPESVCATVVGTETRYSEGYGDVVINVIQRGCEHRSLFHGDAKCLSDPRSGDILSFNDTNSELPRTSFTGEACFCIGNDCNTNVEDFERQIHPHYPDDDVMGLQCISCYSRYFPDHQDEQNGALNQACINGDLTSSDVVYITCNPDHACLKVHGNLTYFLDGVGGRAEVIERRCIPKDYTDGKDQGCLIMDEIRDNLQYEYSSYYFYFDAIVIDAPACFCSEDVCDCDIDTCTTKDISCEDDNFCNKPNEVCSDTANGPECVCEPGYQHDERKECKIIEQDVTCEKFTCDKINTVCLDINTGPQCVCKENYKVDADTLECTGGSSNMKVTFGLTLLLFLVAVLV